MRVWCETLKNTSYYICEDYNVLLKADARRNNTRIGLCVITHDLYHNPKDRGIFTLRIFEGKEEYQTSREREVAYKLYAV